MRRWMLLTLLLLILAISTLPLAGLAWSQGRGQGFRPCPYSPYACPVKAVCKPFAESGQVVKLLTETLEDTMHPGMAVLLDTKNRGQVHVHLGPVWYLERQEFNLVPGDQVQVKGMCEQVKAGKTEVIAYELIKGDYVLSLRNAQGRPNWEAWRRR